MRVGLDYLPATTHAPGRGRYARELVRALCRLDVPDLDLRLFDIGRGRRIFRGEALGLDEARFAVKRRRLAIPRRIVRWVNRVIGFGADGWVGGCDVFHHGSPVLPPVESSHAVLPVPELPLESDEAGVEAFRESIERIVRFITFSEHTRTELARRFDIELERIHVTRVGCGHWRRALNELPERSDPPYVLMLGCPRDERRPELVLKALEVLIKKHPGTRLVLAGTSGKRAERFARTLPFSAARSFVEWRENPVEEELPELVARASCVVHLAVEEGTPVTGLEALSMGTPVVCNRIPAYLEALEDDAHYVDLKEIEAQPGVLSAAIEEAFESARDTDAIHRRIQRASAFTWRRCAKETVEVWRRAAADEVHDE